MAMYMSYDPIKKIGAINNHTKAGLAALKRINYIIDQEDQIPSPAQPKEFPEQIDSITFDQVHFSYEETPTLIDVNIKVPHQQVVALVALLAQGSRHLELYFQGSTIPIWAKC